ncbi:MAG: hypothetical protein ACI9FB_003446 [Candidatus Azotimanducaceae bacterium]|jgi:hypothetical protein
MRIKLYTISFSIWLLSACSQVVIEESIDTGKPPVNFAGHWEIDHKLTESPSDKLRWLYEVARSQIEQRRISAERDQKQNRSPLGNVGAINDLQAVIGLGTLVDSISRSTVLEISQDDEGIVIKRNDDYALTCDFEGPEVMSNSLGSEFCRFDPSGQLIVAVGLPEGLFLVNRLVMSSDRTRLNVATTLKSKKMSQEFTLNRVYMPFEPGEGLYECKYTLKDKKTCWLGSE